jgi:hypothetical protein
LRTFCFSGSVLNFGEYEPLKSGFWGSLKLIGDIVISMAAYPTGLCSIDSLLTVESIFVGSGYTKGLSIALFGSDKSS